ncbi:MULTISPECIES: hypothetical protein [unclassified Pseudoxanthomonas]|uniref:hypothetical protein n=1 Tax=unclassified Pseudoxanthomonas TaxID=2645906 RepID=UPI0030777D82
MKSIQYSTLLLVMIIAGCSGEDAEKTTSGAVSKAVELAKGAMTGVSKGVEEGRKASSSADGALLVSTGNELKSALDGEVLRTGQATDGSSVEVTLGFSNPADVPVRVTGLIAGRHMTALDKDGYACETLSAAEEFTVPAKAKLKVEMVFDCGDKSIAMVRLFDVQYPVMK